MAIVINGNGIDMGNSPISNVDVGVFDNNAATVDYVKNNGDINAVTSFSQISGTNEISGVKLTNNIHDVFGDGSAVATYQLNGNANDLGGTYNGTATNVTYEEGKFSQAAKFNDNGYISLPKQSLGSTFTVSLWWKPNNSTAVSNTIFSGFVSSTVDGMSLNIWGQKILFGTGGDVHFQKVAESPIPSTSEFTHIVAIKGNGTNASKLYVNGTFIGSGTITHPVSNQFVIGKRGTGTQNTQSSIDQVRIFNRALTESEINTLYTETRFSANAQLNISQGTFIYPKGLGARGYKKSSDIFSGTVDVSTQTDGWKYVAKDENNNFSFYTDRPTIGKKSSTLYLENGKLYKTVDDTPITPISFLSNKVRIASGVPVELAPSDISKTVSESLEAGSYFGKNAIVAYASIDMTTTPPTILDSYNIASVIRSSNGVGKVTLKNPTDKDAVTAICGSNSVAGTITATTKNEVSFATGSTNYAKTSVIVIGGKF